VCGTPLALVLRQLVTPKQQEVSLAAAWVGCKQQVVGACKREARISAHATVSQASEQEVCLLTLKKFFLFAAFLSVQVWPFYTFLQDVLPKACRML
jgi:transcriptional regulator of acetoin/glycerol metabolism